MTMHILDNNMHLQLNGKNVQAVEEFSRAGGTHIILSHKPYADIKINNANSYKEAFNRTLKMAEMVRRETEVRVFVTLGPYPVDLVDMLGRMSIEKAQEVMKKGMDLASSFVEENLAIALGEIGRPHFTVNEDVMHASNEILRYGMESAKDIGCAVVLHTESSLATIREIAALADDVGLPREKVVKHFCPPVVGVEDIYGMFPSIIASKKNIVKAASFGNRFLMETDYIDDPRRPGAVLGPASVPKTTRYMLQKEFLTKEDVVAIHKTNPERIYGIRIE